MLKWSIAIWQHTTIKRVCSAIRRALLTRLLRIHKTITFMKVYRPSQISLATTCQTRKFTLTSSDWIHCMSSRNYPRHAHISKVAQSISWTSLLHTISQSLLENTRNLSNKISHNCAKNTMRIAIKRKSNHLWKLIRDKHFSHSNHTKKIIKLSSSSHAQTIKSFRV